MSDNTTILGKAGASAVNAYKFCVYNALVIDQSTSAGAAALGVAVETAAAGENLTVVVSGLFEVDCAASIAPGAPVASDGNGEAVTAVSTNHILGVYLPVPVNGVVANSVSGTRIRILVEHTKKNIFP